MHKPSRTVTTTDPVDSDVSDVRFRSGSDRDQEISKLGERREDKFDDNDDTVSNITAA